MATVTFDTARLAERLQAAGLPREQADAVMRAIADAQDELVTKRDLEIALAPLRARMDILQWGLGLNVVLSIGTLGTVLTLAIKML
jgi:hypothetical protein